MKPDSIVIIGDSRSLFDMDLDALEQGLGQRPVQLGLVGSCAYPILENLANDEEARHALREQGGRWRCIAGRGSLLTVTADHYSGDDLAAAGCWISMECEQLYLQGLCCG